MQEKVLQLLQLLFLSNDLIQVDKNATGRVHLVHKEWILQLNKMGDKRNKLVICNVIKYMYTHLATPIQQEDQGSKLIEEVDAEKVSRQPSQHGFAVGLVHEEEELVELVSALYYIIRNDG